MGSLEGAGWHVGTPTERIVLSTFRPGRSTLHAPSKPARKSQIPPPLSQQEKHAAACGQDVHDVLVINDLDGIGDLLPGNGRCDVCGVLEDMAGIGLGGPTDIEAVTRRHDAQGGSRFDDAQGGQGVAGSQAPEFQASQRREVEAGKGTADGTVGQEVEAVAIGGGTAILEIGAEGAGEGHCAGDLHFAEPGRAGEAEIDPAAELVVGAYELEGAGLDIEEAGVGEVNE